MKSARTKKIGGVNALSACCPFHEDSSPSFAVFENGGFACKGCGKRGHCGELAQHLGIEAPGQDQYKDWRKTSFLEAVYTYVRNGETIGRVERYKRIDGSKAPIPMARMADGSFVRGLGGHSWPPYRIDEAKSADPYHPVFWVEGEKCADFLVSHGFTALTSQGGSSATGKIDDADLRCLKGRRVYVIPDNDAAGEKYAEAVARKLRLAGSNVRIVRLPGLTHSGDDVVDWFERGLGCNESLARLCESESALDADTASLIRLCNEVSTKLEEGQIKPTDARRELLSGAASSAMEEAASRQRTSIGAALLELAERIESGDLQRGLKWGIPAMDALSWIMPFGTVVTIGGGSGSGKTALALQLVDQTASKGGACLVFSQEMTAIDLAGRIAARNFGRPLKELKASEVRQVANVYSKMPIEIIDDRVGDEEILAESKLWMATTENPQLIVVDFMQLCKRDMKMTEHEFVTECGAKLKDLSKTKTSPVVVVALSQIGAESRRRQTRPTKDDLRSGGGLVESSDQVWISWKNPETDCIEQYLDKHRNGPTGFAKGVRYHGPSFTFYNEDVDIDSISAYSANIGIEFEEIEV